MNPEKNLLQGKIVMINGAGRGPGPALTKAFTAQGARIAACEASPVLLDPVVAAVQELGGEIRPYLGELARGMPARSLVDEILTDFEHIDILINNPRVAPQAALLEMDEWDWQHTMEVNLNGPFLMTQIIGRQMIEKGGGIILNLIASGPNLEVPGLAAYAASQQGLLALTRTAAQEFIAYNIHIVGICLEEGAPAEPEERLTDLAIFLCGPASKHLSGQVFRVPNLPR
jgi:NAD(P)-dependent dehydrogenase (short-subunit alcohol dehydrogenase family)